MYRRFRLGGYLFNYQSQVTIELQGVAAQPFGLCLAKEVLSNCVIIVQSLSISIFALPEIARDTEPRPGEARVFQAQHISTALCSEGSAWSSAVIIPYCAPYPAQRASPPSQPISILIHEREIMESVGTLNHFLVYDSPGYSPKSSILRTRSPNNLPSAGSFTETNLYVAQIRTGVHPYFLDVVASPTSGRGLWLEWRSQSIGRVVLFDAGDGVIDDPSGKLSDIGPFDDTGSTRRGSRIGAKDIADAFRDCTDFSLDDGTGRVVVVASHGQVHILQFGTA
ncbi:uncharacterized protein EI90DRAFT_249784 [Cantharellus anzutake]|uniref:uncharacterized protein n=1 Tax=Cantharellus anzutake TaxID=1750568 RepID=UPI0019046DAE|nr:uncharacterized protein EI90DRAFT_249784 [Cantharellus anzutake]KAF8335724.1 hypothetical protein EI90DRAFT_249784 [Cantharellus anzutake]